MSDSQQHILDRDAAPRVQITYDVQKDGAKQIKELPGIVGILADAVGMPLEDPKDLAERRFLPIDGTKLHETMRTLKPHLAFEVKNTLEPESKTMLPVDLVFRSMDDFTPAGVAKQVAPLKELLAIRQQLSQLLEKLRSKSHLARDLQNMDRHLQDAIQETQNKYRAQADTSSLEKGTKP